MSRCQALTRSGDQCSRSATDTAADGQRLCWLHHPSNREQRSAAASRAGRARKGGGEVAQVKRELRALAERVVSGDLETARGAVASQLLGTFLRACEIERRQREQELLEERVAELEERVRHREGGRWAGR